MEKSAKLSAASVRPHCKSSHAFIVGTYKITLQTYYWNGLQPVKIILIIYTSKLPILEPHHCKQSNHREKKAMGKQPANISAGKTHRESEWSSID